MKLCFSFGAHLLFVLFAFNAQVMHAQAPAQNPSQSKNDSQSAVDKSYWKRAFKLSGSIRERWEATDGPFSVTPADSYWISQERLGVLFQPTEWVRVFAQAQDTRVMFYQTAPSNSFSNPFDLHQAWVSFGQQEGPGTLVELGRQDLVIGSGHLLAATDDWWTYTARNFDVARGSYSNGFFKSELVAGSVVLINPGGIDEHRPGDHIYADYNTFPHLVPGASVEPYLIARTSDNVTSKEKQLGNMDTIALGVRLIGKLPGRIDYNFEPLHEFGGYSNDHLDASGLLTGVGWIVKSSGWKPRLSVDYSYASGDDGKKNGARETFDNMFGFNYPMNSLTGQFAWKNIEDFRSGVEFTPLRKLKVKVNARQFWLANVADGLYNAAGTRTVFNPKATSAHVGESVEMMATATLTKKTTVGFGVGTLFPGEYLKQSGKDAPFTYPYIYLAQTF